MNLIIICILVGIGFVVFSIYLYKLIKSNSNSKNMIIEEDLFNPQEWYKEETKNWKPNDIIIIDIKKLGIYDSSAKLISFDEYGNITINSNNKEIKFNFFDDKLKSKNLNNITARAKKKIKQKKEVS